MDRESHINMVKRWRTQAKENGEVLDDDTAKERLRSKAPHLAKTEIGRIIKQSYIKEKKTPPYSNAQVSSFYWKFVDDEDETFGQPSWGNKSEQASEILWSLVNFPSSCASDQQYFLSAFAHYIQKMEGVTPPRAVLAWIHSDAGVQTSEKYNQDLDKNIKKLEELNNKFDEKGQKFPIYEYILATPKFDTDDPRCFKWVKNHGKPGKYVEMKRLEEK